MNKSQRPSLSPCPFCGYRSACLYDYSDEPAMLVRVECPRCGASTVGETVAEASAAWNRRPHDGHACRECAHVAHSYKGVAHCHNPHALVDIVKDDGHACPYYSPAPITPPPPATPSEEDIP